MLLEFEEMAMVIRPRWCVRATRIFWKRAAAAAGTPLFGLERLVAFLGECQHTLAPGNA